MAGLARMFASIGTLLGLIALGGAELDAAPPVVELRGTNQLDDFDEHVDNHFEADLELILAEDNVLDRPTIAADLAERARWTMPAPLAGPLPR